MIQVIKVNRLRKKAVKSISKDFTAPKHVTVVYHPLAEFLVLERVTKLREAFVKAKRLASNGRLILFADQQVHAGKAYLFEQNDKLIGELRLA